MGVNLLPEPEPEVVPSPPNAAAGTAHAGVPRGESRLRTILQSINDTITVIDADGRVQAGTGLVTPILGYDPAFWQDRNLAEVIHPDDLGPALGLLAAIRATPGARASAEMRVRASDGTWQLAEGTAVNLLDDPDVGGILLTTRNITRRRRNELLVRGQADVLRLVAAGAPLGDTLQRIAQLVDALSPGGHCVVHLGDQEGTTTLAPSLAHPRAATALADRLHIDELDEPLAIDDLARTLGVDGVDAALPWRSCWAAAVRAAVDTVGGWLLCLFEQPGPVPAADLELASVAADLAVVAIQRAQAERRLSHLALHDELTGLANRHLLVSRLDQAIQRARRHRHRLAVLFLDIDRFKAVNDSFGHEVGDAVLSEVARRLRQAVRPEDTVARFGGDEFVVLVEQVHDDRDVALIAERLVRSLAEPFQTGTAELRVTASLGIVVDGGEDDAARLLRSADLAMYRAKQQGRDRLEVFDERLRDRLVERRQLAAELGDALQRRKLRLRFEPTRLIATGRLLAVRARPEWVDAPGGPVGGEELVALAEDGGLDDHIWRWTLHSAAAALSRRPAGDDIDLVLELSARGLSRRDATGWIRAELERSSWPARRLLVAVPGEALSVPGEATGSTIAALARLDVGLSVGGAGRVAGALVDLARSPVRELTMPRELVRASRVGGRDADVVRAVVAVGAALSLRVVADGVDDPADLAVLTELGCPAGRGAAIGAAVSGDELVTLAETRPGGPLRTAAGA